MIAVSVHFPRRSIFRYEVAGGVLRLIELWIPPWERGRGTALMRRVLAAADRLGLAIELVADPTDRPGDPDTAALVRWYTRLGFRQVGRCPETGSPAMRREPCPAGAGRSPGAGISPG